MKVEVLIGFKMMRFWKKKKKGSFFFSFVVF